MFSSSKGVEGEGFYLRGSYGVKGENVIFASSTVPKFGVNFGNRLFT